VELLPEPGRHVQLHQHGHGHGDPHTA
jgi:hypothetical protein